MYYGNSDTVLELDIPNWLGFYCETNTTFEQGAYDRVLTSGNKVDLSTFKIQYFIQTRQEIDTEKHRSDRDGDN